MATNDEKNNRRHLTLDEYEKMAVKLLTKFKYPHYSKSVDAIYHVMRGLINADIKFNGHGSLYKFRSMLAYQGLLRHLQQSNTQKNKFMVTVDPDYKLEKITTKTPEEDVMMKELLANIESHPVLTKIQKFIIQEFYLNSVSDLNLALELKLHRSMVHYMRMQALKILRRTNDVSWKY